MLVHGHGISCTIVLRSRLVVCRINWIGFIYIQINESQKGLGRVR